MKPLFFAFFCAFFVSAVSADTLYLDTLDLSGAEQDEHPVACGASVLGGPIKLMRHEYKHGLGTTSNSMIHLDLHSSANRFQSVVGLDRAVLEMGHHSIEFQVIGDDRILWRSGVVDLASGEIAVDVDIKGVRLLTLYVRSIRGRWNGHSAWADARIDFEGNAPEPYVRPLETATMLTPPVPDEPKFNGPSIIGARPEAEILHYLPVSGKRPLKIDVKQLPKGLSFDSKTGTLHGKIHKAGDYLLELRAENDFGKTSSKLMIRVGEQLALTPPMGWNSWNCWGSKVNQTQIQDAANAMKSSGLADFGWSYINIDDGWQGARGGKYGAIMPNENFPDMAGLCSNVHKMGLKIGIYSSPWTKTYAQMLGSSADTVDGRNPYTDPAAYRIEFGFFPMYDKDARQWAEWGFDFLKLDWFPNTVVHTIEFGNALRETGRDFVYSLSNAAPIKDANAWAQFSNMWRTTGDIIDSWGSIYSILLEQNDWQKYAGPGHWNDPDMLVVGWLSWGKEPFQSKLTPTEQYSHISMWALLAAPMLLGCDLDRLDDFTLNLLNNREVIAINQDALGVQAKRIWQEDLLEIWSRPLSDGSIAVGLCNFGLVSHTLHLDLDQLDLDGKQQVRDVWRQKDEIVVESDYQAEIPAHGVHLIKLTPVKSF